MQKLIIEVRMNEGARKETIRHVPYRPDEIVADALACAEAGASIVHFHARHADGSELNDVQDYCEIIGGIRARSDVMVHPTLGLFQGAPPEQRLAHIRHLCEVAGLTPDIAPLDMGSNNIDLWDPVKAEFRQPGLCLRQPLRRTAPHGQAFDRMGRAPATGDLEPGEPAAGCGLHRCRRPPTCRTRSGRGFCVTIARELYGISVV